MVAKCQYLYRRQIKKRKWSASSSKYERHTSLGPCVCHPLWCSHRSLFFNFPPLSVRSTYCFLDHFPTAQLSFGIHFSLWCLMKNLKEKKIMIKQTTKLAHSKSRTVRPIDLTVLRQIKICDSEYFLPFCWTSSAESKTVSNLRPMCLF